MKIKKIKKTSITLFALLSFFIIPMIVFAVDDTFSLGYLGGTHTSREKSLPYDYPYIIFYNHNTSVDAELAASVEKKGLLGFTFKERLQKWVKGLSTCTYSYNKYDSGTYRAVFVVNQMNGSGYVDGGYLLSSSEIKL